MSDLAIANLVVNYGKVRALRSVSLDVPQGRVVAIVGANGAGKSTLLKAIMGVLPIVGGTITFGDETISGSTPTRIVRAGIAISPEGRRLFPELEVEENLLSGGLQRSKAETAESLEQVYDWFPILRERRRQVAGSLSGGQQQMVAIGRAMMSRPRLLLLDEPSLGLSPLIMQEIVRIIRKVNEQGISVVLVEQNARLALKMADKAYVLQTGQIALSGTGADLLADEAVQRSYLGM